MAASSEEPGLGFRAPGAPAVSLLDRDQAWGAPALPRAAMGRQDSCSSLVWRALPGPHV